MKKFNKLLISTIALPIAGLPAISVASCNKQSQSTDITINGPTIVDADTVEEWTAVYTAVDKDQQEVDVAWTVSDMSIATISKYGILTPIKEGVVDVVAVDSNSKSILATLEVHIVGNYAKWVKAYKQVYANFLSSTNEYKTATASDDSTLGGSKISSIELLYRKYPIDNPVLWKVTNEKGENTRVDAAAGVHISLWEHKIIYALEVGHTVEFVIEDNRVGLIFKKEDGSIYQSFIYNNEGYLIEAVWYLGSSPNFNIVITSYNK